MAARVRSFVTHAIFGIGLYVATLVSNLLEMLRCEV